MHRHLSLKYLFVDTFRSVTTPEFRYQYHDNMAKLFTPQTTWASIYPRPTSRPYLRVVHLELSSPSTTGLNPVVCFLMRLYRCLFCIVASVRCSPRCSLFTQAPTWVTLYTIFGCIGLPQQCADYLCFELLLIIMNNDNHGKSINK